MLKHLLQNEFTVPLFLRLRHFLFDVKPKSKQIYEKNLLLMDFHDACIMEVENVKNHEIDAFCIDSLCNSGSGGYLLLSNYTINA